MARVTGLSGNEIYCLALKNYAPGEIVVGNSVNSMGFLGAIGAGINNLLGGEVPQVTQAIFDGRAAAFARMTAEAQRHGASGVAGVAGDLRSFGGSTEFLFVGSCVHAREGSGKFFTSAGDAQELYCHMDAGYAPVHHVFGNIAYSIGIGGGVLGFLKSFGRGEITEYSDIFNHTRHAALDRAVAQARHAGANSIVGIRTKICDWAGTHEMMTAGTAAINPLLPDWTSDAPVTSDLTGEELWAMTSLGYAPVKLLMSTSVYSLGFVGSLTSLFKSFQRGEVNELTTLIHDAREIAIDRIKREANELGAEEVIGVKTYIANLGSGLVEFLAIGTAMNKLPGAAVASAQLPPQAIIQDKDTWMDNEFGFSLDRARQG